jgi:hypothetical protein
MNAHLQILYPPHDWAVPMHRALDIIVALQQRIYCVRAGIEVHAFEWVIAPPGPTRYRYLSQRGWCQKTCPFGWHAVLDQLVPVDS